MKKIAALGALALLMGSVFQANAASTGTITFNGSITDATCDVSVDGTGADATVQLPVVAASELASAGQTTGRTNFTLGLSNCNLGEGDSASVAAFFQPGTTVDSATGRLIQTDAAGAENVSLQLRDGTNDSVIFAGDSSQMTTAAFKNVEAGKDIKLPYSAEYYAEGKATAGAVASSVVYNLQYK
ncbi:fimbrial protein [Cedecea neteri]|uniref:fimbrial protein n=1 Tax=Cedecea neteri TaxID=158822 RepID=UPI002AA8AE30|nr:fimbrial protein [Cedecea neteri]WPU21968.1 fimbrial protein [Cedecea neteri]